MQLSVKISSDEIIKAVKTMSPDELEMLKTAMIRREIYFKKFKKDNITNIIADFSNEGYSAEFVSDLEAGLKKSSVYNADKKVKK